MRSERDRNYNTTITFQQTLQEEHNLFRTFNRTIKLIKTGAINSYSLLLKSSNNNPLDNRI